MTKTAAPKMLSITRGLGPGHFMMYSHGTHMQGEPEPILIRNEIAIGPQATASTKDEDKVKAVPARLESAELRPGDDMLILRGSVRVSSLRHRLTACDSPAFRERHNALMEEAISSGVARELAQRYAITLLSGFWGWRNSDSASSVTVSVSWEGPANGKVTADNLLLSAVDAFDPTQYPEAAEAIQRLASVIEAAMTTSSRRATLLDVEGIFALGVGAPVYPSQEWADKKALADNGVSKVEEYGLSRVLAKMQLPDGSMQAFMTERKVGNQLRRIDTWYPGAHPGQPIAIEAYGANVREAKCLRPTKVDIFSLVKKVCDGARLDSAELHYYTAMTMRGGVFSGGDK